MPHSPRLLPAFLVYGALALLPCEGQAQGTAGEIALSDESLQLRYLLSGDGSAADAGELGFGLFLSEDQDIIISSHYFLEADRLRFDRLTFKAGPVAYAALLGIENTDVFSIALAAEVRFELLRREEVFIVARGAYAPDILTFGTADNLLDLVGQIELPLTDRVIGFAGYRLFEFELLDGDREVEESARLGIRYRF